MLPENKDTINCLAGHELFRYPPGINQDSPSGRQHFQTLKEKTQIHCQNCNQGITCRINLSDETDQAQTTHDVRHDILKSIQDQDIP